MKKIILLLAAIFVMNIVNAQWQRTSKFGHPVGCSNFVATDSIIYGYNSASLYKTINYGLNWIKINAPTSIQTITVKDDSILCGIFSTPTGSPTGSEYQFLSTSIDNGLTWKTENDSFPQYTAFNDIIIYNNKIYLSTSVGLYTSENGLSWNLYGTLDSECKSVSLNDNKIFAITNYENNIKKSYDNGNTWTDITNGLHPSSSIYSVLSINNKLYVLTGYYDSGIYQNDINVSDNDGITWNLMKNGLPTNNVYNLTNLYNYNDTIYVYSNNNVYNVSTQDTIWQQVLLPFVGSYFAKNNVNLIGNGKCNYVSLDYGSTWNKSNNNMDTATYISSLSKNGNDIYATTEGDGIFKTTDRGQHWIPLNNVFDNNPEYDGLVFIDTLMFSMKYWYDSIYKSYDQGQTWINIHNGIICPYINKLAVNGLNLYALTDCGLYTSTDYGQSWILASNGLPDTLIKAIAFNGNNIYIETYINGLFLSNNNGASWSCLNSTCNGNLLSLEGNRIIAGGGFNILYSEDNGLNWDTIQLPPLSYRVESALIYSNELILAGYVYQNPMYGGDYALIEVSFDKGVSLTNYTGSLGAYEEVYNPFILNDTLYVLTSSRNIVWKRALSDFVGIKESTINNNISVYPNPTKDNLTIETNFTKEQRLEIINLIGQTVYTNNINKKATINTSAFAKGVYILKLSSDKETIVRKFVKE